MIEILFALTVALYAASCAIFLAQLAGWALRPAPAAKPLLALGALVHLAFIARQLGEGITPTAGIHQALSSFSILIALSYLAFERMYRLKTLGAFITPIILLMLLSARFGGGGEELPDSVRGVLLPVHIAANLLGEVAFALAFALAVAYLVQERQLKRKRFGGVFTRLPSLDVLDSVSFRCVTVGFLLLTIGIVLGAVFSRNVEGRPFSFSVEQVLAVLTWGLFALVLAMRASAGWRGRRAAIGTVVGCLMAAAVLVTYLLRASGGGVGA